MSRFLLEAASKGDARKVQDYLDKGTDVGWYQKESGRTALTEASFYRRRMDKLVSLASERTCRGPVMAESSSAWRRLLREKQAATRRVPTWQPTLLAFTNGAAIRVIC